MDDEGSNTPDTGSLGLRQSSSEPQQRQQLSPSPIRTHKDISSLQPESLVNEKENKEASKLPQFTVGRVVLFSVILSPFWIYF